MRSAGFDEDGQPIIAEVLHERQAVGLEQRFASGKFNDWQANPANYAAERFSQPEHFLPNFTDQHLAPLSKSISSITVRAAEITGRQAHKNARQPCERALTLKAQVDFVNDQRLGHSSTAKCQNNSGRLVSDRSRRFTP